MEKIKNIYTINYFGGLGGEFVCSLLAGRLSPDNHDIQITDKNRYLFNQDYPIRGFIISHLIKLIGSGQTFNEYINNQSYPIKNRFSDLLIEGFYDFYNIVKSDDKNQAFNNLKLLIAERYNSDKLMFVKLSLLNDKQLIYNDLTMQFFFPNSTNIYLYTKHIPHQMFVLLYLFKKMEFYSAKFPTPEDLIEHMKCKYFCDIDLNKFIDTDYNVDVSTFYLGSVQRDIFKFAGIEIDPKIFYDYAEVNCKKIKDTFDLNFLKSYDNKLIEQKCFDFIEVWYKQNR